MYFTVYSRHTSDSRSGHWSWTESTFFFHFFFFGRVVPDMFLFSNELKCLSNQLLYKCKIIIIEITAMAGNSPELKWQKKKKEEKIMLLSVTRLKVLLRNTWKRRSLRGAVSTLQKCKFATSKRIFFLIFYYSLNECDINRLLPAHLNTENTFYLAI